MLLDAEQQIRRGHPHGSGAEPAPGAARAGERLDDLDGSPFHAGPGEMDAPFGLTDTVHPFTASTAWDTDPIVALSLSLPRRRLDEFAVPEGVELARPVEHRQAPVEVAMYSHPRLDEVAAVGLGRNLQALALEAHAVVSPDGALVVLAQDVGQSGADEGHEGAARLGRRHRELLVDRRAVELGEIAVRLSHRGDAVCGELLGQAFLMGGKHAFAPPTCFGRVGGNHLHANSSPRVCLESACAAGPVCRTTGTEDILPTIEGGKPSFPGTLALRAALRPLPDRGRSFF